MFEYIKADFKRVSNKHTYKEKGIISKIIIILLFHPGFQAVLNYRFCHWLVINKVPIIYIFLQRITEISTGISIPPNTQIGKGLLIEHFGGIVIEGYSIIGENCTITYCVSIGKKEPFGNVPNIGNSVYICVGAKVLGDVTLGDNCIVGANAVVLTSFPPNSVIAGVPAKRVKIVENDCHKNFNLSL